jgi:hypothetical protein
MSALMVSAMPKSIDVSFDEFGQSGSHNDGYSSTQFSNYIPSGSVVSSFTPMAPETEQQSSDSLAMYQEFYSFDQGTQSQARPVQFDIDRSEPTYLIVNGQSQPYNPSYVPYNSLWIQGTTRWTQYMQCPLNARFKLLAFSQGGPATVIEVYPDGYQTVNNYQFYPGYTQFFFWADAVGRHTLTFNMYDQVSNPVVVDVVPYNGPYNGPYSDPI